MGLLESYAELNNRMITCKAQHEGVKRTLGAGLKAKTDEKATLEADLTDIAGAREVIDQYCLARLKPAEDAIHNAVSEALAYMGGRGLSFVLEEFQQAKSGRQLRVAFKDGEEIRSLRQDCGRGDRELVSLIMTCILLLAGGSGKVLLLDEVVSGVSKRNQAIVDKLLSYMESQGFLIVLTEHGYTPTCEGMSSYVMHNGTCSVEE